MTESMLDWIAIDSSDKLWQKTNKLCMANSHTIWPGHECMHARTHTNPVPAETTRQTEYETMRLLNNKLDSIELHYVRAHSLWRYIITLDVGRRDEEEMDFLDRLLFSERQFREDGRGIHF